MNATIDSISASDSAGFVGDPRRKLGMERTAAPATDRFDQIRIGGGRQQTGMIQLRRLRTLSPCPVTSGAIPAVEDRARRRMGLHPSSLRMHRTWLLDTRETAQVSHDGVDLLGPQTTVLLAPGRHAAPRPASA